MKKKTILDNCLYNFEVTQDWKHMSGYERFKYLDSYGNFFSLGDGYVAWNRTKDDAPSPYEGVNDNYWNSKCQSDGVAQYLQSMSLPGTSSSNGVSVDIYNALAKNDLWEGGYVSDIGFVDAQNSSDLGCSLFLNGSWEPRGTANNPVSVCDFYEKKEDGLWPGAYVDTWGYVGNEMSVLGCSASFETANYEMNQAASLINAMRVLGDATSNDGFYVELRKFWDSDLNCVAMTLLDMENILRREFNVINENVKVALAKHDCVYVRQLKKLYERNGYDYYSSYDVVLIGYDYALNAYGYIDPVTSKVSYMPVERLSDADVCFYVFSRL